MLSSLGLAWTSVLAAVKRHRCVLCVGKEQMRSRTNRMSCRSPETLFLEIFASGEDLPKTSIPRPSLSIPSRGFHSDYSLPRPDVTAVPEISMVQMWRSLRDSQSKKSKYQGRK